MEESKRESLNSMLTGLVPFWKSQHTDWRVTVVRSSLDRLGYQIVLPYLSLYIISLGATKAQLGTITSVGMLVMGFLGPFVGGFINRNGAKKTYLAGIFFLLLSYLLYAFALDWRFCLLAMVVYYFGNGLAGQSCSTICGSCLKNCDRARGMLICESLAAGLLGMAGPLIAAFLLKYIIGAPEEGAGAADYKYLFFASAFCCVISFLFVLRKLSGESMKNKSAAALGIFRESRVILKSNPNAVRGILIGIVSNMPVAMVIPYAQVYASEVKLAGVTPLAAMVTASALVTTFAGYPAGVLADKFGRKKVMFVIIPLFWLSNLMLIFAPSTVWLVAAGAFQGFYYISSPLNAAIQRELVDQEHMNMWIGLLKFINAAASAISALIAGFLYDKVGPASVFVVYMAIDLLVRIPSLAKLPETLKTQ